MPLADVLREDPGRGRRGTASTPGRTGTPGSSPSAVVRVEQILRGRVVRKLAKHGEQVVALGKRRRELEELALAVLGTGSGQARLLEQPSVLYRTEDERTRV